MSGPARTPAGSAAPGARPCAGERAGAGERAAAWAQLLRVSALFTVPGDALAGAAAGGRAPNRGTVLAIGASLCLYEAGMALNDWADRDVDAVERPERPLPSGRISPRAAFTAAAALTAAGLGLAAGAGRSALGTATALAGSVWAYDLGLKHTPAGPAAMATARTLDLLLGATATAAADGGHTKPDRRSGKALGRVVPVGSGDGLGHIKPVRRSGTALGHEARALAQAPWPSTGGGRDAPAPRKAPWPANDRGPDARPAAAAVTAAALLGAHTLAVTTVSRRETVGGSTTLPLAALAGVTAIAATAARATRAAARPVHARPVHAAAPPVLAAVTPVLAAAYAASAARPLVHAALNPSPQLFQRAVGGGIRAMIPLQAVLAARSGSVRTAVPLLALLPLARRLSRKVSPT